MTSGDRLLLAELQRTFTRLQHFKVTLDQPVQTLLDNCEWNIRLQEGQGGLPLLTLRLQTRIHLDDPLLLRLAEQAERYFGPIDFALFSGETSYPLRVLSRTLLDRRWRWRHT